MKRALPLVLIAVIAVAIVALVVMLLRGPASEPVVGPATPTIKPMLHAYDAAALEVGSGALTVPAGSPFDLRITLESSAYVYLFDETEGQLSLVWKHQESLPWEKGEYSAEAPAFEGLGPHQLILVAAPTAITNVETWRVVSRDALRDACALCESASYAFMVSGALDGGQ